MSKNIFLKLLITVTFIGWLALVSFPTISHEYSFYKLKKNLNQEILRIIDDKKISSSKIDLLINTTHKHTYESFACLYQDDTDECSKHVPTPEEENGKYIKWGLPASDYKYKPDTEMKEYLGSLLKNTDYSYDRYMQLPNQELKILFNSEDDSNTTIMLTIDMKNNTREISSLVIGKTSIFDKTF